VLACQGDHDAALTKAQEIKGDRPVDGPLAYGLACVYARATAAAQGKEADHHAAGAIEWLGKARAAGFFKDPSWVAYLPMDPDLAALQTRPEFQKLLAEAPPQPKKP
jgi:hypothetical protein